MATVAYPSNALLLQQESAADAYYGFPQGTMQALGNSESSNGTNVGSLGTIFQVLPSTAANPGYGLGPLNGNDPMSVGGYLAALLDGPAQGDLPTALALYQGRTPGSPANASLQSFIDQLGQGINALNPMNAIDAINKAVGLTPDVPGAKKAGGGSLTGYALQIGAVLLAIILIGIGVAAIALKDTPVGVVQRALPGS